MALIKQMYTAIDCQDAISLANFYASFTGLNVATDKPGGMDGSWVELIDENNKVQLAFQKIANYRRPTWPEGDIPQQAHLDFLVDELDEAEDAILKLGASKARFQPGSPQKDEYEYEFRVYLDPEGHPFCLISTKR